jgi:hypothetical protein
MEKVFYHTQESRSEKLKQPIPCDRDDAWLGTAIYFWLDLDDAEHWGNTSKKQTGYYEIYKSDIDCQDILDSVFNEAHYFFWCEQIEKVAKTIIEKTKMKPTIKELNDYFKEKATWEEVSEILFQDLPANPDRLLIRPIDRNKKIGFVYRKRIQLAVYNPTIIHTFELFKREKCI